MHRSHGHQRDHDDLGRQQRDEGGARTPVALQRTGHAAQAHDGAGARSRRERGPDRRRESRPVRGSGVLRGEHIGLAPGEDMERIRTQQHQDHRAGERGADGGDEEGGRVRGQPCHRTQRFTGHAEVRPEHVADRAHPYDEGERTGTGAGSREVGRGESGLEGGGGPRPGHQQAEEQGPHELPLGRRDQEPGAGGRRPPAGGQRDATAATGGEGAQRDPEHRGAEGGGGAGEAGPGLAVGDLAREQDADRRRDTEPDRAEDLRDHQHDEGAPLHRIGGDPGRRRTAGPCRGCRAGRGHRTAPPSWRFGHHLARTQLVS